MQYAFKRFQQHEFSQHLHFFERFKQPMANKMSAVIIESPLTKLMFLARSLFALKQSVITLVFLTIAHS